MIGLAEQDRAYASSQIDKQLNFDEQQIQFADRAVTNAQSALQTTQSQIGWDGILKSALATGDPQAVSRVNSIMGPGFDLHSAATVAAQKTAQEAKKADLQNQVLESNLKTDAAQRSKIYADAAAASASDAAVNPNVLQGMLNVYKSTGVLPTFGNSAKSPLRAQFYAALGSPDGAQMVTDANTNKTVRAGLTTAYKTQQNLLSANQTAIGTLDKQLNLVSKYSDQVGRTDSPLINKYLIGAKTGVFGDPDTAALNNIVKTASYEFAKILGGSAASIGGVSVQSAADAESMLNSAMSKGQFNSVIDLMKKEADFRINSQKDTLSRLQGDMNNVGSLAKSLEPIAPTDIPSGYYQASDGLLYKK
jgi:hypothetical protein